mmetsp:Transcript_21618/g.52043  ORF Transcript_21618/g.52043 Transcript_21618/m.52043 type:complete len:208 (+) Transcript_21618:712-1335(+)
MAGWRTVPRVNTTWPVRSQTRRASSIDPFTATEIGCSARTHAQRGSMNASASISAGVPGVVTSTTTSLQYSSTLPGRLFDTLRETGIAGSDVYPNDFLEDAPGEGMGRSAANLLSSRLSSADADLVEPAKRRFPSASELLSWPSKGSTRWRRAVHCPAFSIDAESRAACSTWGVAATEMSVFGPPVLEMARGDTSLIRRATSRLPVK